jgi:hypothetical protein
VNGPTCTVCGRRPVGSYEISLHEEVTCTSHDVLERCVLCSRPRCGGSAGWSRFTSSTVRCPTCVRDAVDTQEQARAHIPRVRRDMAALGIELTTRVRVELRDPDLVLVGHGSGVCLGVTKTRVWSDDRAAEVLGIEIARGLTPVHFGQVVAHEIGHAWLHQNGAVDLELALAEGLCELFAGAWLKRHGTPIAAALRDSMMANPDPVYGGGYRMVRDAVIRQGITDVLNHIRDQGSLP